MGGVSAEIVGPIGGVVVPFSIYKLTKKQLLDISNITRVLTEAKIRGIIVHS